MTMVLRHESRAGITTLLNRRLGDPSHLRRLPGLSLPEPQKNITRNDDQGRIEKQNLRNPGLADIVGRPHLIP